MRVIVENYWMAPRRRRQRAVASRGFPWPWAARWTHYS